ncbi:hypothetical protein L7F22_010473 [Adiantum nelumboides]|nr:hypothetical protein [Adiantum nelumboides]
MTRTKATVKRRQQSRRVERGAQKARLPEPGLPPQAEQYDCEGARESTDNTDARIEEDRALPAEPRNGGETSRNVEDESRNGGETTQDVEDVSRNGGETRRDVVDEEKEEEEEEDKAIEDDGEEGQLLLTDYEKQREQRLKDNAAKLASLNLPSLASSLGPSRRPQRQTTSSKKKIDDDYVPSSSSDSQDSDGYDTQDDCDFQGAGLQVQQDQVLDLDEDQAIEQAIALSLQIPADTVTKTKSKVPRTQRNKRQVSDKKGSATKRRKGVQEQFTAEEIAAIFSIIDEQGNGKFSVAELERVVRFHDFTWSKQEIADMIDIFDSDKDGQLDLPEFQSIFGRMNMLRMT